MSFGLDKIIRNLSGNSIINVMYHGVVNSNSNYYSPRHIDKTQFEKHLIYYKNNFEIISTAEAFRKIYNNKKLDKIYLTVSFDDGYKNNLTTALPLLEKYNIPTTFFISGICTNEHENQYLWPELMSALKYFYKNEQIKIKNQIFINLICKNSGAYLPHFIQSLPYNKRDKILKSIDKEYSLSSKIIQLPKEIWKLLNDNEIIKLSKSNIVTIGSHGYSHFNMKKIAFEGAKKELIKSKNILEKTIGLEVKEIAYPYGSYNNSIKNLAEEVGYKYQFAVSYNSKKDFDDARIMNRHAISSTTNYESNILNLNRAFLSKAVKSISI